MKTQNHYGNSIKNLKKKKSVKLHLNFKLFIHVFSFKETLCANSNYISFPGDYMLKLQKQGPILTPFPPVPR